MTCPICSNPSVSDYRPFCSRRCADIDLAKWLGGHYALPSSDPGDAEQLIDEMEKALSAPAIKPH